LRTDQFCPKKLNKENSMKYRHLLLVIAMGAIGAGCTSIENSRNLANPNVPAKALAQQVCSLCHGINGQSVSPNFPNLAAQQPTYFTAQMKEFRGHNRLDPAGFEYMWGLSRSLTDEQISGLAEYFATKAPAAIPNTSSDPATVAGGAVIFEKGVPEKNIPSCSTCHGAQAQGKEQFPRLANQHSDYLVKQLMVFQRTDERPEGSIMKTIAHDLTRKNMEDVAAYLQDLPAR
jgi:cytochrome c553